MSDKHRTSEIGNINQQIDKIKKQIQEANTKIKKDVEQRNQLHEQAKKTREEIKQIKTDRDNLNEKVKVLKEQRDLVRVKITPIMDEIKTLDDKIAELRKKVPRVNQRALQEELDSIEWKISTTSLDLQEEKRLVGEVKELELQLSGFKKIDARYQKIKELLSQRKALDAEADVFHKEMTELAKRSQELHSTMVEKFNAIKRDRAEADLLHQAFIKAKEQNMLWYAQIRLLMGQSTGIRNAQREQYQARRAEEDTRRKEEDANRNQEQEKRAQKELEIKEKIGSVAPEKLQRGEKLSWDEFQVMMGDVEEDDSETQA